MLRLALTRLLQSAIDQLVADGRLPVGLPKVTIEDPKDPSHGDFATNFALIASKAAGMPPRQLAEVVVQAIASPHLQSVEVAGPGFINLRLDPAYVASFVRPVLDSGVEAFKASASEATEQKQRINIEFVSVNPNGPITIGSGRGAAFGSTLANVLEAAGHTVHREYYINDGVNSEQMRLFAESVRSAALAEPLPENGYKGDYVFRAGELLRDHWLENAAGNAKHSAWLAEAAVSGDETVLSQGFNSAHESFVAKTWRSIADKFEASGNDPGSTIRVLTAAEIQHAAMVAMTSSQDQDLTAFGVRFDRWFSEQSLHDAGVVEREIGALASKGAADDRPIRYKLKLAKGGKIEDVEIEEQGKGEGGGTKDDDGDEDSDLQPSYSDLSPTLWLRSTKFGDDMDRVVRRKDGRLTYIASDVAYHKDKFNRPANADKLITILGPDHHGYIGRLHAVLAAIEAPPLSTGHAGGWGDNPPVEAKLYANPAERDACHAALDKARNELDVVIYQLVRFMKDGKPAPMRKRDGNIYALIDLIDEIGKKVKPEDSQVEQRKVGKDVARFFYLMRSHDTTFDFDLDLAEKQSDDNPVFYVQYAHARICSVIRKAAEVDLAPAKEANYGFLTHPKETALIKKILDLPHEVGRAAEDYGVHRLTTYAIELARAYHHFYDACRVIQPDQRELSQARLALCEATRIALKSTFELLGIEAPEQM